MYYFFKIDFNVMIYSHHNLLLQSIITSSFKLQYVIQQKILNNVSSHIETYLLLKQIGNRKLVLQKSGNENKRRKMELVALY